MIPAKWFYVLCGTCVELSLLAAVIHSALAAPALATAVGLYYYAESREEKE